MEKDIRLFRRKEFDVTLTTVLWNRPWSSRQTLVSINIMK